MDKPIRRVEVRAEGRSNVPRWGQPQSQPANPQVAEPPPAGATGDDHDDTACPNIGPDTSKENSAQNPEMLRTAVDNIEPVQNPEMLRTAVDNIEQHLRDIDLALKSPLTSSGLPGVKEIAQSMPQDQNIFYNL